MTQPEQDPNEQANISGADLAILVDELKSAKKDAERLDALRKLCGYVEDGSHTHLSIGQDDATGDWYISVGDWAKPKPLQFYGGSLRAALDAAVAAS